MTALGQRIDRLRRHKGWTWAELGRRAQMHPQTIYKIVHTQGIDPRVSALARMALAFEVSLSELAGPLEDLLPQRADADDAHAA